MVTNCNFQRPPESVRIGLRHEIGKEAIRLWTVSGGNDLKREQNLFRKTPSMIRFRI
jgi:hypothetical protein